MHTPFVAVHPGSAFSRLNNLYRVAADDATLEERHVDQASLSKAGCNYLGHAY